METSTGIHYLLVSGTLVIDDGQASPQTFTQAGRW